MHKINVVAFGSKNFNISLEELKDHLNFELTTIDQNVESKSFENYDILFCHEEFFKISSSLNLLKNSNKIKILAFSSSDLNFDIFTDKISLPTTVKDINFTIENSIAKKKFLTNSSIKIKGYILDKNEKKLVNNRKFVLLTEKEIQLLELFLNNTKPINRNKILNQVWRYSKEADTHTVETHIYRLRKKVKSEFEDDNFILNEKDGYTL